MVDVMTLGCRCASVLPFLSCVADVLIGAQFHAGGVDVLDWMIDEKRSRAHPLTLLCLHTHPNTKTQAVILEWLGPVLRHEAQAPGVEGHWGRDTLYTLGFAITLALMYSLTAYFLTEVCWGVLGWTDGWMDGGVFLLLGELPCCD